MPNVTPHSQPQQPPPVGVTEHCRQYALIHGLQVPYPPCVYGTENMTDYDILHYLRANREQLSPLAQWKLTHSDLSPSAFIGGVMIVRFEECIICRVPSPCPHVLDNGHKRWRLRGKRHAT